MDVDTYVEEVEDGRILLLVAPSDRIQELNQDLVRYFTVEEDALAVYVTVSKPSSTLDEVFEEADVETDNVFYIDCATKLAGGDTMKGGENRVYLHPSALTNLSIALSDAIETLPDGRERILVFDTLSTLTIHNDVDTVSRFAHTLTSKIRQWDVKSIILMIEEEADDAITAELKRSADKTIELSDADS